MLRECRTIGAARLRRILGRIQGAWEGAYYQYPTDQATQNTAQRTSRMHQLLRDIPFIAERLTPVVVEDLRELEEEIEVQEATEGQTDFATHSWFAALRMCRRLCFFFIVQADSDKFRLKSLRICIENSSRNTWEGK